MKTSGVFVAIFK